MENSFFVLHQKIVQKKQLDSLLKNEIELQRSSINSSIKKILSDLRSYSLLDVWYPKLTEATLLKFLSSSIYKREKVKVYESTIQLPYPTNTTLKMNNFLSLIYEQMDDVLKCVCQYFLSSGKSETLKYIPTDTTISFFASSTFPSIFGYNWCVEEGLAYIDALLKLIELVYNHFGKSFINSNFRNSFLRDIIRQFFHSSGIAKFLQLSLSGPINALLTDERLYKIDENSMEYILIMLEYYEKVYNNLMTYLPKIPYLIQVFFVKCFEFARNCTKESKDPNEKYQIIDFLFFDLMISPAILNPKLFALIPETTVSKRSPHLATLTKIFRWKLIPLSIPEKFKDVQEDKLFSSIQVSLLLKRVSHFDISEIVQNVIFGNTIKEVTETKYHFILTSANDIQFLAHIMNEFIDKIDTKISSKGKIKSYSQIEYELNLETDELLDFWYFSYEKFHDSHKKNEPLELYIPIISPHPPVNISNDIKNIIYPLITYIQNIIPNPSEPNSLLQFLQQQLAIAEKKNSYEMIAKTQIILSKIQKYGKSEPDIIEALNLIITEGLDVSANGFASSFKHQECLDNLEYISSAISELNHQLLPIMHQSALRVFLNSHKEIHDYIKKHLNSLVNTSASTKEEWINFFKQATQQLHEHSKSIGLDSTHQLRLVRQLHSSIMSEIPFKEFSMANPKYTNIDEQLNNNYDNILQKFVKDEYSDTVMQLFNSPGCFDSAVVILQSMTKYGALEKLSKINESISILYNIYFFEAGEGCPGDDFLPIFIYTLLLAKLPNLAMTKQYLKHFLSCISESVVILEPQEKYALTAFFSAIKYIIGLLP